MKDKLVGSLGCLGYAIHYSICLALFYLPLEYIGTPFWLNIILVFVMLYFNLASIGVWIWGLVVTIQGVQDLRAIFYYVIFAIGFLPFIISIVGTLIGSIRHKH